jgi:dipeptidyl aminopeptidase/acylaminoacyl peptidase
VRRAFLALALAGALTLAPAAAAPAAPPTSAARAPAAIDGRLAVARGASVVVLDGGALSAAFAGPPAALVFDPAWSPDGARLAFARLLPQAAPADDASDGGLFVLDVPAGAAREVVRPDAPGAQLRDPAWSPDGAALVYSYYRPVYEDGALASETIEVRRTDLASGATTSIAVGGANPTVSPDGATIALVARDPVAGDSLRLAAAAGGSERVLVAAGVFDGLFAPRFSPTGDAVAFSGLRLGGRDRSASAESPLGRLGPLFGVRVALAHGLPWEVWTVPTVGGSPSQLTRLGEDTPCAAWSSDGRRLLVQGELGLYLVDVGSAATQRLGDPPGYGCPAWRSPA